MKGLTDFLASELRRTRVDVVVLDTLLNAMHFGPEQDYRRRMLELHASVQMTSATTLLLAPRAPDRDGGPVQQIADGIIELTERARAFVAGGSWKS